MRNVIAILLLFSLLSPALYACTWAERVDVTVRSINSVPVEGAKATVTYQRNTVNVTDTTETAYSDGNGVASFNICDSAPFYLGIVYDYNVSVTDPYLHQVQRQQQTFDVSRGGRNVVYFTYDYSLGNLTVYVKDGVNNSIEGAAVRVKGPHISVNRTTNASGAAWFITLLGDTVDVQASFGDVVLNKRLQVQDATIITMAAPPPISNQVQVKVEDDLGKPVQGASVGLFARGYNATIITGASGDATFTGVPFNQLNLTVGVNNVTRYLRDLKLVRKDTQTRVVLDLHSPNVSAVTMNASNIGTAGRDHYILAFETQVDDRVTSSEALNVTLYYSVDQGPVIPAQMAPAGGKRFAANVDLPNIAAPFGVACYAQAIDGTGNIGYGANSTSTVGYIPPPATPTPSPTPTPKPISLDIPPEVKGLLAPLEAFLSSVTDYMWVLIFLVLVILGGTVFVFVSVNAFFYMNKVKKARKAP